MNKSDSERICGMLDERGALPVLGSGGTSVLLDADNQPLADIIVFMTCCVREAADVRLLGQVASLKNSSALIAVGGCIGQRDGQQLADRMPHIDIVFGTHNLASLPHLLEAALDNKETHVPQSKAQKQCDSPVGTHKRCGFPIKAHKRHNPQIEVLSDTEAQVKELTPASHLPTRREHPWHAWLPIMTGCNNHCSYCVVPSVRGRERSLPMEQLEAEAKRLIDDGVVEISLLGQNVNSYGRDLYGQPRFAPLLRRIGALGIRRLRFATSHPKDLDQDTIDAFAQVSAVMPALHLPVQSGSDAILKAMNRNYSAAHYQNLVEQLRYACQQAGKPNVALSTDVIVGFPGETDADFEQTLQLLEQIGFAQVFTFIYSRREGTPAAALADDTPRSVIQNRFDRLVACVQKSALAFNEGFVDKNVEVLFEGVSKRSATILASKSPWGQTVHVPLPPDHRAEDYAGRFGRVRITSARTWYLSGSLLELESTKQGK